MNNKIGEGFMYEVFDNKDGTVNKIPRNPASTSLKKEELSFSIHKKSIGDSVANSSFIDKNNGLFEVNQEFIKGNPVDLVDFTKMDVIKILEDGANMQDKYQIFFDVFGLQGMIRLFNYYFNDTILKKIYDLSLPLGDYYLNYKHNFPKGKFIEMNKKENNNGSVFIAHNLLEDEDGNIRVVDTDYRPLDIFHPLNLIGNWITKKALKDSQKNRYDEWEKYYFEDN